ncbi:MAG TPA: HAD domain-containing protein [Ignavibacteriaceae bacterium]
MSLCVLYLDFDGVLHPKSAARSVWTEDSLKLEGDDLFRWIPDLENVLSLFPDVKVVIHSSWRYLHTEDQIKEKLGSLGERVLGLVSREPGERYVQILDDAKSRGVSSIFILDDDIDACPASCPELISCHESLGISDVNVQKKLHKSLCNFDVIYPLDNPNPGEIV